jgi:pyrroline-5-carboxylate reductase
MGEALVAGLLAGGWGAPGEVAVVERLESRRRELNDRFPGVAVSHEPLPAEGAVVAVKPDDVESACRALSALGVVRVLSIAAGVRLSKLQAWLGEDVALVRAMPNTPALVGEAASAIAAGHSAEAEDLDWAEGILSAVGQVVRVPERLLDAVTGLSGSGPAYFFLVAEALVEAGVLVGLPREVAVKLVDQTMLGSARLLHESPDGAESLRAAVTSPGGTTAAGLKALEARGLRAAFLEAVQAATAKSRELGGQG